MNLAAGSRRRLFGHRLGIVGAWPTTNVHVLRGNTGWRVVIEGRARPQSMHDTQRRARETARATAKRSGRELLVHGRDGQIRERETDTAQFDFRVATRSRHR
jgi:hypothetical protein